MPDYKNNDDVRQFMQDVQDQIQYKPIVTELCNELYQHMEERQDEYMDQGMDQQKAARAALQDLGDPSEIGVLLNQIHRVENPRFLLFGILALVVVGGIYQITYHIQSYWYAEDSAATQLLYLIKENIHIMMGIPLLFAVIYLGYPWLIKHSRSLLKGFVVYSVIVFLLNLSNMVGFTPDNLRFYLWNIYMLELPILMLSVPILMIFSYKIRNKWRYSFLTPIAIYAVIAFFGALRSGGFVGYTYEVIFLIASFFMFLLMAYKRFFSKNRRRSMIAVALLCVTVLSIWGYNKRGSLEYYFKQCFYPDTVANDYLSDAYNSLLIKDLLSRANLIGEVELSEQEMISYFDYSWYYDGIIKVDNREWRREPIELSGLEDILPQHYHNNYMIAYFILSYGWLPGIFLILLLTGICFWLISIALQIRNPMGQLTALSAALCITLQVVFYIMGNLGYQFGYFCVLPYLSEGKVNHITNILLTGILISAYRYDKVIKEPEENDAMSWRTERI
jgi:hypothetical protein